MDILETKMLANVIVVRDIDSNRNPTTCEGDHIESGEIGLVEFWFLGFFWPRQTRNQLLSTVHEGLKLLGLSFIDASDETFPLRTFTETVTVIFDETCFIYSVYFSKNYVF